MSPPVRVVGPARQQIRADSLIAFLEGATFGDVRDPAKDEAISVGIPEIAEDGTPARSAILNIAAPSGREGGYFQLSTFN
jgi:hypothetical protein